MEIYTTNIGLQRQHLIDEYYSFIWKERFNDLGDFELHVPTTPKNRAILNPGGYVVHTDSTRIMDILTLEEKENDEGIRELVASGLSHEKILDERVLADPIEPEWSHTSPPADVARQMFNDICVDFNLTKDSDADTLDWLADGNLYPPDTLEEPADYITVTHPPVSLLKAIREICVEHRLGFRITRNGENKEFFFNIYAGSDRTPQGGHPFPVTFSERLDSLKKPSYLATTALEKTMIWVTSQFGDREIVQIGDGGIGYSRKQMVISAEDIVEEMTPEERSKKMQQQGRAALAACRPLNAFDGEADVDGKYRYDRDYFLGDLVGIEGAEGQLNYMRVTEQIFVSDAEGYRTYPTLSVDTQADAGTWLAWGGQKQWVDMTTETWATVDD